MFTGIIEEVGRISSINSIAGGKSLKISASKILDDTNVGDSISVNGVCLTVTSVLFNSFTIDAVGETLFKTTINKFNPGDCVNLERAMKFSQRIGGHLVPGHVTNVGLVSEIKKLGENYSLSIELPENVSKYVIDEGSIAIDGISLTVAKIFGNKIILSIIPHTWKETNLSRKKVGDRVNLEVDLIAKYVEKFMHGNIKPTDKLTEESLREMGY